MSEAEKFVMVAAGAFDFDAAPTSFERCNAGHINDTFFIYCGKDEPSYILQRVNTNIFKDPERLMENIWGVCEHLRKKTAEEGGDPDREVRKIILTKSGNKYFIDEEGGYWRAYLCLNGVLCLNEADKETFYKSAIAFGHFFCQLADYPAETLAETIPNFHNSVSRYNDFRAAVEADPLGRAKECPELIEFALSKKDKCSYILDRIATGEIKLCVTHNDTKLNNVLLDEKTKDGVCVIDLDTVMPGSILYDFGDSIRFGASSAKEDETDLDKVYIDLELFETYVEGFLKELRPTMTEAEVLGLPMGAYLMTYETGVRFLGDYLTGDTYFKTHYPGQNLDRAKNQLKLIADMDEKMPQMEAIVRKYL
jgi:hypothetical protein